MADETLRQDLRMTEVDPIGDMRLSPVTARARIEILDILRGIAILGIFYMNIPTMGGPLVAFFVDPRLGGWMVADRWAWSVTAIVAEGTQRGMLEMLFGAGMLILTAKAMAPDGPVAIADLYLRRTLWLLVFGLADVFLLLWPGDILHTYALASLLLFPFRRLPARMLVMLGLAWSMLGLIGGLGDYAEQSVLVEQVQSAHEAQAQHRPLSEVERSALSRWSDAQAALTLTPERRRSLAEEARARRGPLAGYAQWLWSCWLKLIWPMEPAFVAEAFSTMLIGMALFKWGFIQGQGSRRAYLGTALAAYAFGCGARALGVHERLTFQPGPQTIGATAELARLAVTLGHIALVNLLVQTRIGHALLRPFAAAGRTALSLYVCETLIGIWLLFPGFGLGLWDHFGWMGLTLVATATIVLLLIAANLYSRWFAMGPLEWAWRSLAYGARQRFRLQTTSVIEA